MVIDTHVHVLRQGELSGETLIAEMDAAGIDKAFMITYTAQDIRPQFDAQGTPIEEVAPVYSKEHALETWRAHRDRLFWFTGSIDPDRPGYLDDLQADLDEEAVGVKLLPVFVGMLPDNPGFRPVYELCRERDLPIILDPSYWYLGVYPLHKTPQEQRNIRDYAQYAALMSPIFDEFNEVRFCVAHYGTPNLLVSGALDFGLLDPVIEMVKRPPNVCVDLAAMPVPSQEEFPQPTPVALLQRLIAGVGAENVMFGTDYPYFGRPAHVWRNLWRLIDEALPSLSREERDLILYRNALRLVGGPG
jgi:predicted TIM-barrel fold metal-dependent hydrolase